MEVGLASILGPLHPRERDGSFPGALTEAKQERPWLLVLEQGTFSLLADKTHDAPIIPEAEQVFLNEFQDGVNPRPEGKVLIINIFLKVYKCTIG